MSIQKAPSWYAKNDALNDALYNQDKAKAQNIYLEIKTDLTEGDCKEVEKQIARIPTIKSSVKAKK